MKVIGRIYRDDESDVVLVDRDSNPGIPRENTEGYYYERYVTWVESKVDGSRFWGHYFDDLESAREDFQKRA